MDQERIATRIEGLTGAERARAGQLVGELADLDRMIARAEGRKAAVVAELAAIAHAEGARSMNPDGVDYARRAMAAEVAAVTRTHPVAAKNALEEAEVLTADFPQTHEALAAGRISARHARVICEAGRKIDIGVRGLLDGDAAVLAEERTPGDLAKIVRKRAAEIAASSLGERHERERKRRFVSVTDLDDAMSRLVMYLPTFEAHAIYDRSTALAKVVKSDRTKTRARWRRLAGHPVEECCGAAECVCARVRGAGRDAGNGDEFDGAKLDGEAVAVTDHRTLDQLRTDILTDLFLGATPTGHDLYTAAGERTLENVTASVQVTIPASMIIDPGRDSERTRGAGSAWLDSGSLLAPDTARKVAGRTPGWERLFIRERTGVIEYVDHYRPSSAQRRSLIGRDLTCRFPGCTTPARKADIDHTHDYARGGKTTLSNLACLCEGHHVMKHQSGWGMRQLPGGVIEWTSPTGRTYQHQPESRVYFRNSPEAPGENSAHAESSAETPADIAADVGPPSAPGAPEPTTSGPTTVDPPPRSINQTRSAEIWSGGDDGPYGPPPWMPGPSTDAPPD
ncbi:MAG: DUF222 domain-containing protein [Microbacterium gubbeenense]